MHSMISRLLLGAFAVGLLGFGSGCIVRAEGYGHSRVRYHDHGPRRSYYHCHERGGPHRQRVCHNVRHGY